MPVSITNAILLHIDPLGAAPGGLRVEGDEIAEVGPGLRAKPGDESFDARGAVVLPGLVNGHTHLYSALAAGMPPPPRPPRNFHDILKSVWWRLDRALDPESIRLSAAAGALDAIHCGTTTLIDHHASPGCIAGSLDLLEQAIEPVGPRAVLCYEATDRNGPAGFEAGLAESRRYLERRQARAGGRFATLVGAHAAFTLADDSLRRCVELAESLQTGLHIHVAEDPCDDAVCREHYGAALVDRLHRFGPLASTAVASRSILAHATHLAPADAERLSARVLAVAHNPASNMNNAVGYAPIDRLDNVMLGTDGIGGDMLSELRLAWLKARDARIALRPSHFVAMLAHAARVAGQLLGRTLGKFAPGAAADLVVTDYRPATPLDAGNTAGHLLFALAARHVRDVMIAGRWALRDRAAVGLDEDKLRQEAREAARRLWERMAHL